MRAASFLLAILIGGCTAEVQPGPVVRDPLPAPVVAWAEGAKDMVWQHTARGAPPPLTLERVELCDDFAIVFFAAPPDGRATDTGDGLPIGQDLLWAAGLLSESPEGADGGWTSSPESDAQSYRSEHGPCVIAFER